MAEPMTELELIRQLGERLGRPLEELSEDRFERHAQAKNRRDWKSPDRINKDAYALAADGTVRALFLDTVISPILFDFPWHQLRHLTHLYLSRINLKNFDFLAQFTQLTTLDLRSNRISDWSFLSQLTGLTSPLWRYLCGDIKG